MAEITIKFSRSGYLAPIIVVEVRGETDDVLKLVEKIREIMKADGWKE